MTCSPVSGTTSRPTPRDSAYRGAHWRIRWRAGKAQHSSIEGVDEVRHRSREGESPCGATISSCGPRRFGRSTLRIWSLLHKQHDRSWNSAVYPGGTDSLTHLKAR